MAKTLPFTEARLKKITNEFQTPFHIYDEKGIRRNARKFNNAFSWVPGGFINYFALKACPNPHILKILNEEGFGADCSSLAELIIAEKVGLTGDQIMFSSNNTPLEEFSKARELGATINLDDLTHIEPFFEETSGKKVPELLCFRYTLKLNRESNEIIGDPHNAKFGMTKEQLFLAYERAKELGVKKFGLHTMVISNELNHNYFIDTAREVFHTVVELGKRGIPITFVNLGGGVGIPYKPGEKELKKQVKLPAIIMALRRIGEEVKESHKQELKNIKLKSEIVVRSDLFEITINNSKRSLEKIKEMHKLLHASSGDFLGLTEGLYETTIIANAKYLETLKKMFSKEDVKVIIPDLSALTLRLPIDSWKTPGLFYTVTKKLNWHKISIAEIVSTLTEMTFILKKEDTGKAFDVLSKEL